MRIKIWKKREKSELIMDAYGN